MKYLAVGITKDNIWVCLSKPCKKEEAAVFDGCQLDNEVFALKTKLEVNNHKKVLK